MQRQDTRQCYRPIGSLSHAQPGWMVASWFRRHWIMCVSDGALLMRCNILYNVKQNHLRYNGVCSAVLLRFTVVGKVCCSAPEWLGFLEDGSGCSVPGAVAVPLAEAEAPAGAVRPELSNGRPEFAGLALGMREEGGTNGLDAPRAGLGRARWSIPVRI